MRDLGPTDWATCIFGLKTHVIVYTLVAIFMRTWDQPRHMFLGCDAKATLIEGAFHVISGGGHTQLRARGAHDVRLTK